MPRSVKEMDRERMLEKLMIQVNLLQTSDIDEILELEQKCFPDDPWSRGAFEEEIKNSLSIFLVAREEETGEIIGYGGVWLMYDVGNITNLAVAPNCRQSGIGRRILQLLIDLCVERGMTAITLEVRKSNLVAQKLYQSEGFVCCGLRKRYYQGTEDAVIMTLELITMEEEENADFSH